MPQRALFRYTSEPERNPNQALAVRILLVYNSPVMIARLPSAAYCGIEAVAVEVEVDVSRRGFAGATVVGLPDTAVKGSIEGVRSAVINAG
ncbi:MAG: hypothetical protein IIC02_10875 [Planctomycetes bacterium]|nr:hypothetical protein [Planctomycetota bacterium]